MNTDDVKQRVINELEVAVTSIRANMASKNINATGRTSDSVRVRILDNHIQLVGGDKNTAPFPSVEIGLPPGSRGKGFYKIIRQWSINKGLTFANDRERSTFAYFAAKKIEEQGTQRHAINEDVYSSVADITAENVKEILRNSLTSAILSEVRNVLNN